MKIILLLIAVLLIGYVFRKTEVKWKKQQKEEKKIEQSRMMIHEQLKILKDLKEYDEKGYEKETAEEIKRMNERIDGLMDDIFKYKEEKNLQSEVEQIQKDAESLKERMITSHKVIDQLKIEMNKKVDEIKSYLSETNFYPPHFALDNNKLSGMILEIEERRRKNPFINLTKYKEFGDTLYEQFHTFRNQHEKIVVLIEKIEREKEHYPSNKVSRVMEMKNDLYLTLHKGEMDKSEKILRELTVLIK